MQVISNYSVSALPYNFEFDPQRTALMIIDMQNDFCEFGGFGEMLGNDIQNTRSIIPAIERLLIKFRENNIHIIHTREGHLPDLSDCPPSKRRRSKAQGAGIGDNGKMGRILIRGERGHQIIKELAPIDNEWIIDKPGKGAFYQTSLHQDLQAAGIEKLILTGVTTHVCVHSTLREANDRGYECLVLEDATAAFQQADHYAAINMVHQQGGIFGWVSRSDELLKVLS
ncbi:isochorismatase family cysteine hydrolase [Fictibacillus enclensis]|uniref:cysteine hydrolase family protein n=1 Tax=Fictibacillus enclensis TaxID=1017270 RepID=UPI0025A0E10E|nr:isochorismatase family cysteine hydrolase [Fictibacillus enclensis]MDM5340528.1 isochorismatase family cysteine hydrolase [Fictibacillus enclensis]